MPLHAITSVYGEAGLGRRLLIEIADLAAADRRRVDIACSFMSWCTRATGGSASRTPTTRCGSRSGSSSHYGVQDPDVACAALLHDTVEDHAADFDPMAPRRAP